MTRNKAKPKEIIPSLEEMVEKIGSELKEFKIIARKLFHSWKLRPEYFNLLDQSYAAMKEHAAHFNPEIAKRLLASILETRLLFDELRASYRRGEFRGAALLGYGQEAIGAGIGAAMQAHDVLARDHRSFSAAIARGVPSIEFQRNHHMRATSLSGGYDPNVHFADLKRNDLGFMVSDMAMGAVVINGATWYLNQKRQGERICGVAIIGDGAASNGLAHGGMNFAKSWELPVVFAILNNQISLGTPPQEQHGDVNLTNRGLAYEMPALSVDGDNVFAVYLAAWLLLDFARRASHPALLHALTWRRCGHNESERRDYEKKLFDQKTLEYWTSREKDPLYIARKACEKFNFLTEDDYQRMLGELKAKIENDHRQVLGEPEPDPKKFRMALIDPQCQTVNELAERQPEDSAGPKKIMSFKEAIQRAFREEFKHDPSLIMLGEDIGWPRGGVFEITAPLLEELKDRIRNAPLDEAAIGGFVAGVCLMGGRAIGEYQFWNFFLTGASPVLTLMATRPFMMDVGMPAVLRGATGYAPQSNHYHENLPEAYLLKTHGIKVVIPSTPADAKGLLKSAIRDPDLVAVLEEMSYYGMTGEVPEGEYFTPFRPIVRREGKDITLITWGPKMLDLALTGAEALAKKNIDVEVIDLRVLNPLDKDFIFRSIRKTGRVIILHEDSKSMGFGAEIAAAIAEDRTFYELRARIIRVAALNTPIPPHLALEDFRLPDAEKLAAAARTLMEES